MRFYQKVKSGYSLKCQYLVCVVILFYHEDAYFSMVFGYFSCLPARYHGSQGGSGGGVAYTVRRYVVVGTCLRSAPRSAFRRGFAGRLPALHSLVTGACCLGRAADGRPYEMGAAEAGLGRTEPLHRPCDRSPSPARRGGFGCLGSDGDGGCGSFDSACAPLRMTNLKGRRLGRAEPLHRPCGRSPSPARRGGFGRPYGMGASEAGASGGQPMAAPTGWGRRGRRPYGTTE